MTGLAHLDPMFKGAVSIQAVNEPIMDATLTPGYGECTVPSYLHDLSAFADPCVTSPKELRLDRPRGRSTFRNRCPRWISPFFLSQLHNGVTRSIEHG